MHVNMVEMERKIIVLYVKMNIYLNQILKIIKYKRNCTNVCSLENVCKYQYDGKCYIICP